MQTDHGFVKASDGADLWLHRWRPEGAVRGAMLIAHGLAEHSARYERLARALVERGWVVHACDHRGHGRTAKSEAELGFFGARAGWHRVVLDLKEHVEALRKAAPDVPLVFFGHSMGSLLLQRYLARYGRTIDAAVLSGTSGKPPAIAAVGRLVARLQRIRKGPMGRSRLINHLAFGAFNKAFAPNRTEFDWLSRDPAEVDRYVADPKCGFNATIQLWIDLLDAIPTLTHRNAVASMRTDMPVLVFAGDRDPVGDNGKSVAGLVAQWRAAGIQVSDKLYPEARHETLNETNRDEVTADLIGWLEDSVLAG